MFYILQMIFQLIPKCMRGDSMKLFFKHLFLFLVGGFAYVGIEILFRGYSHISMFLLGGLCFSLIGGLNEIYTWDMSLISQMYVSSLIITLLELVVGITLNLGMGLHVWDYSDLPYNFLGQICLLFYNIWFYLSLAGIILDDYIRYFVFNEEKPHYKIF